MRKFGKSRIASIAKVSALALCFALVFAFTLAFGNGLIADDDAQHGLIEDKFFAQAGQVPASSGSLATHGTAGGFRGTHGNLSAKDFDFPGTTPNKTSWTYKEDFAGHTPSGTTQMVARGDSGAKLFYHTQEAGSWHFGLTDGQKAISVNLTLNYEIPDFIVNILQNPNITVKVQYTAHIWSDGAPGFLAIKGGGHYNCVGSDDLLSVTDGSTYWNSGTDLGSIGDNFNKDVTSPLVTLESTNKYIGLLFSMNIAQQTSADQEEMKITDLKLTFTISMNASTPEPNANDVTWNDGGAPVLDSEFNVTGYKDSYSPYNSDVNTSSGWAMYHEKLKDYQKVDGVTNGSGELVSYTSSALPNFSGTYKRSLMKFVDTYDYSYSSSGFSKTSLETVARKDYRVYAGAYNRLLTTSASFPPTWTSNTDHRYVSGIKSVEIAIGSKTYTANMVGLAISGSRTLYLSEDGRSVGTAYVKRVSYGEVEVDIRFSDNCTVSISVSDYASNTSSSKELIISGIDKTNPANGTTLLDDNGNIKTSADGNWFREQSYTASASHGQNETNDGVDLPQFSPYVWFLTIAKGTSAQTIPNRKTFNSYAEVRAASLSPLAIWDGDSEDFTSFSYNFETGKTTGFNGYEIDGGEKGAGYYRFTFHLFDMSGRKGEEVDFYVRVDYDVPEFNLTIGYGDNTIDAAHNGMWANALTSINIAFPKGRNISGNTVVFRDSASDNYVFFSIGEDGNLLGISTSSDSSKPNNLVGGQARLYVQSELDNGYFTVTFDTATNTFTMTFDETNKESDGLYSDFILKTQFTVYAGGFEELNTSGVPEEHTSVSSNTDDAWTGGVKILIDRNAPETPKLDPNSMLNFLKPGTNNYNSNVKLSDRVWHDSYSINDLGVLLEDKLGMVGKNANYRGTYYNYLYNNQDITIYYAIKNITDQAGMIALQEQDIESTFTKYDPNNQGIFDTIFNLRYESLTQNGTYTYGSSSTAFNLYSDGGVGMRVIYVWAVDEAGNASAKAGSYFVLADATNYSVSAAVKENADLTDIAQISAGGNTFKRGANVNFTVTLANGIVPFKFTRKGADTDGDVLLLENYTPKRVWSLATGADAYKEYLDGYSTDYGTGQVTFSYKLDDPVIGPMQSSLSFEFERRQVVHAEVLNTSYTYTAKPVALEYSVNATSNADNVKAALKFAYKLGDNFLYDNGGDTPVTTLPEGQTQDSATYFVPINVGSYELYIFIPKDNAGFVLDNFKATADGQEIVKSSDDNVQIRPAQLTVKATGGSSVYGEYITLEYTLEGLQYPDGKSAESPDDTAAVLQKEGITITLALKDVANWSEIVAGRALAPVNSYKITSSALSVTGGNYESDIAFTEADYTVSQRGMTIHTVNATKQYGDGDPDFKFSIAEADFDWLTKNAKLDSETLTVAKIAKEMFPDLDAPVLTEGNYLFNAGQRLHREEGEQVKPADARYYDFLNDMSGFEIGNNFVITLDVSTGKFEITKRNVALDLSGNERQITSKQEGQLNNLKDEALASIKYSIPDGDMFLKSEIDDLIAGKFMFGKMTTEDNPENPNYDKIYKYEILFSGGSTKYSTDNFDFTLENAYYLFDVLGGDAIIIALKSGESFSYVYGYMWKPEEFTYEKLKDKFSVTSDSELTFTSVTWTATIEGQSGNKYLNTGNYFVTLSDIHIYNNDQEIEGRFIAADNIQLTITPARIEIAPNYSATSKVYGEDDSKYGIDFTITKINDQDIHAGEKYGDYTYEQLLASVRASFVRAVYTAEGVFRRIGSLYDTVTNESGVMVKSDPAGDYYGMALSGDATLDGAATTYSNNFYQAVTAAADKSVRFVITQKEIDLKLSEFIGISRPFDGTDTVTWGTTLPYDLLRHNHLVLNDNNLNVSLTLDSKYTGIGQANKQSSVGIIFSNITLTGDQAFNYVLKSIVNDINDAGSPEDSRSILKYGADGSLTAEHNSKIEFKDNKITVTIFYLDNATLATHIYILAGSIGLYKSDVTITKIYDNSNTIDISNVSLTNRSGTGGTSSLYTALQDGKVTILSYDHLGGVNVGTYHINITLRFDVEGADGFQVCNNIEDETDKNKIKDRDVEIEKDSNGFTIIITNMLVTVEKLVLDHEDFATVDAVDRDYNGNENVEVTFSYTGSALPTGDTAQSVGLVLVAKAMAGDVGAGKDAGVHTVHFESYTFEDSRNYDLNLADFNANFSSVDVTISKAKLLPNVTFEDKVYDGTTNVGTVDNGGLTTVNYADMLADELAGLSISAPTYALSSNGKEDANIATDEEGNVIAHNVMVKGLTITGDNDILKNYVIYGSRYEDGGYKLIDDTITSGEAISDYEILGALTVMKKQIAIVQNNVNIPDKVYDGTNTATVSIGLSEGDIAENDLDDGFTITATAEFIRHNVGTNIAISLSNIMLQCDESGMDKLKNYELLPYTVRHYGNILARPVAMSADLGTKTYDGSAAIRSAQISYGAEEGDFIASDRGSYAIQIKSGAYFVDKNVVLKKNDSGNVIRDEAGKAEADVKNGAIYSPTLRNTQTGIINYILTYSRDKDNKDESGKQYGYLLSDGSLVISADTPDDETAETIEKYYYELPIADRFIAKNTYEQIADAAEGDDAAAKAKIDALHKGIVGYIEQDGKEGYAIDSAADMSSLAGDVQNLSYSVTYFRSTGKIEQKQVFILQNAVSKVQGSEAFSKTYDGTTKFFGESKKDFTFRSNGISGAISGDSVSIKDVSAVYGGADTSTSYVQFTLAEITGEDADNYYWTKELVTATLSASIRRHDIYAALVNRSIVYGTVLNNLSAEIGTDIFFFLSGDATYDAKSNTFSGEPLTYQGGNFYMNFEKYAKLMGFSLDKGADGAYLNDAQYINELIAMSYNLVDGQFVKAEDGVQGEYIMLGGNFESLPTANISFAGGTSRPNAGVVSQSYTLSGGYATNFTFRFKYTSTTTSTVNVTPMHLFVGSAGTANSVIYGSEYPVNDIITFFDENGNVSTFAPWENYTALFVKNGVDIGPVIRWVDRDGKDMGRYPDVNKTYYALIVARDGYNYGAELPNYVLHFGAFNYGEGNAVIDFAKTEGGQYNLHPAASTLSISLPAADTFNISVVESNTSVVFDGQDHTRHVLSGLSDSDEVHFEDDAAHIAKEYKDGGHVGHIIVKRYIKIDENDSNGYTVEWKSPAPVTINITKASPQLSARNASVSYNGKDRTYPLVGGGYVSLLNQISGYETALRAGLIESEVTRLTADRSYESATIRDAGTYLITVRLTEAFERAYPNFAAEETTATITITKASVNIRINAGEYDLTYLSGGTSGIVKLASVYRADKQYTVDYNIEMVDTALIGTDYAITPDMLEINFFRENVATDTDITGAGKYSFRIVPKDSAIYNNYEFIGADGVLELTATTLLVVDDDGTVKDSIVFEEGSTVIANELVVHRVEKVNGSGEDMALYHSIEQYMPYIDSQASVAAVLHVSLKYDNVVITDTNGVSMTLSIRIPGDVKTDLSNTAVYVSTPDGGLRKLVPAGTSVGEGEASVAADFGTYEFKDGVLTFTTDFLGSIVFVDVAPAPFPQWAIWTLVAVGALVVVFLAWLIITLAVRKIKLYHIDRIF